MNGMTQVRLVDTPEYLDKGLWWPWCSLSGITAFTLVTIPPFICLFRSDDMIDVVRERSRISNLISSKEWKAQVSIWVFLFSFNDWDFFFSLALFYQIDLFGWSWWFLASARISFESRCERFKLSHRFIHYYYYDYSKRVFFFKLKWA